MTGQSFILADRAVTVNTLFNPNEDITTHDQDQKGCSLHFDILPASCDYLKWPEQICSWIKLFARLIVYSEFKGSMFFFCHRVLKQTPPQLSSPGNLIFSQSSFKGLLRSCLSQSIGRDTSFSCYLFLPIIGGQPWKEMLWPAVTAVQFSSLFVLSVVYRSFISLTSMSKTCFHMRPPFTRENFMWS